MMRLFYRLFAFCLALYWVPATGHCRIEALGLEFATCADSCHDKAPMGPTHDGCDVVESGLYKCGADTAKVPAPSVTTLCACLICLRDPAPETASGPGIATAEAVRPRDWVPTWHFMRRAALSPRAPSLVLA
jgi:hypothetical protein